jgi:acetyl esterase
MSNPDGGAPNLEIFAQLFAGGPPRTAGDMRAMLDKFGAMLNIGLPEVGAFHERVTVDEVEGGAVTADVVVPKGSGPHPMLVYLHGGGWICGSPATHRKLAHRFAEAGYLVFNVDYRLAPEHPFPTPLDDCLAAIRWAVREAPRYGGDPERLAVGGDSAGGNLSAAAAAILADDPSLPAIRAALLIYGVFDFVRLSEGLDGLSADPMLSSLGAMTAGEGGDLGAQMLDLMVHSYLGGPPSAELLADPRISPVHAAAKLPPSHIVVGTADPLVAQARELVEALSALGIEHEHVEVEGMPHGFVQMEFFPAARESIARMVSFLDAKLR